MYYWATVTYLNPTARTMSRNINLRKKELRKNGKTSRTERTLHSRVIVKDRMARCYGPKYGCSVSCWWPCVHWQTFQRSTAYFASRIGSLFQMSSYNIISPAASGPPRCCGDSPRRPDLSPPSPQHRGDLPRYPSSSPWGLNLEPYSFITSLISWL